MSDPQNRDNNGKFGKGNNANPGGRPKVPEELKAKARALCPQVLQTWENIMLQGAKDSDRIKASENIYFLSYGKFEQQIHADVDANVNATISIGVPDFVCEDDGK